MSIRPKWWLSALAKSFPIAKVGIRATKWPVLGKLIKPLIVPFISGRNFNITYIPINEDIKSDGSTLLSRVVVEELIRRSSHRVIIERCTCRDGNRCEQHPIELGCLLLGEGSREIDSRVGKHVNVDEALEHVGMCIEDGLIPFVGRFKPDNLIWGVRDRGRLLTICFCCRCCCIILNSGKFLPDESAESLVKLKGLNIITDPDLCNPCDICIEECFMGARTIQNGKIEYKEDLCKGCGHCITVCPNGAIKAEVDDMDTAIDELMGRINSLINIE